MDEFLQMGKHGLYVWSAYGITLLIVLGLIFEPTIKKAWLKQKVKNLMKREQKIKQKRQA